MQSEGKERAEKKTVKLEVFIYEDIYTHTQPHTHISNANSMPNRALL